MSATAVWITGLSGSGKTTSAGALADTLRGPQVHPVVLDGDELRRGLNSDLGFSRADRHEAARRAAELGVILAAAGLLPITAMIAPHRAAREHARRIHSDAGHRFVEVWLNTPAAICAARDAKDLYAAHVDDLDDYEPSDSVDVTLDTATLSVEQVVVRIVSHLTGPPVLEHQRRR